MGVGRKMREYCRQAGSALGQSRAQGSRGGHSAAHAAQAPAGQAAAPQGAQSPRSPLCSAQPRCAALPPPPASHTMSRNAPAHLVQEGGTLQHPHTQLVSCLDAGQPPPCAWLAALALPINRAPGAGRAAAGARHQLALVL